jgi:hypothetical protein
MGPKPRNGPRVAENLAKSEASGREERHLGTHMEGLAMRFHCGDGDRWPCRASFFTATACEKGMPVLFRTSSRSSTIRRSRAGCCQPFARRVSHALWAEAERCSNVRCACRRPRILFECGAVLRFAAVDARLLSAASAASRASESSRNARSSAMAAVSLSRRHCAEVAEITLWSPPRRLPDRHLTCTLGGNAGNLHRHSHMRTTTFVAPKPVCGWSSARS